MISKPLNNPFNVSMFDNHATIIPPKANHSSVLQNARMIHEDKKRLPKVLENSWVYNHGARTVATFTLSRHFIGYRRIITAITSYTGLHLSCNGTRKK